LSLNDFDSEAFKKRKIELREHSRLRNVKRSRNRLVLLVAAVFLAAVGIYSVVRWAVPSYEAPIALPSVSPSTSLPAPENTASVPPPTPSESIVPIEKTDSGYTSQNLTISIEKFEADVNGRSTAYFVADVVCRDMSLFQTAFSGKGDVIPRNSYENPITIGERYGALLTVNCDNAGYLDDGIIVRNGALYRFKPSKRDMLMVFSDGSMRSVKENSIKSEEEIAGLISEGLLHTFSFGPALISDGVSRGDYSDNLVQTYNPRTAIGMVEPGHFKLVVVDGRTDYNRGMRLIQLENLMEELGCTEAYNFDGGQSSVIIFDGKRLNDIAGNKSEREVSDILFFTESDL